MMPTNPVSSNFNKQNGNELLANCRVDPAHFPSGRPAPNTAKIIELSALNAAEVDRVLDHDSGSIIVVITDLKGLSRQYLQRLRDDGRILLRPYASEAGSEFSTRVVPYAKVALAAVAMILLAVLTSIPVVLMPTAGSVVDTMMKNFAHT